MRLRQQRSLGRSEAGIPRRGAGGSAHAPSLRAHPFTLIEILVAVTVFTLVAVAMLAFSRQVAKSYDRLVREHGRFHELLALDRALDTMLSNAVPFIWPNEEGEQVHFFVGDDHRVDLAYLHSRNTWNEGAIRFASLAVDDGMLTCVYASRPYLTDEPPEEQRRVTVLARGVKAIELQYADCQGGEDGEWSDRLTWTSVWPEDRTELPLAILIYIEWQDGRKESWLRRTAGSGYRERIAPWDPPKDGDT